MQRRNTTDDLSPSPVHLALDSWIGGLFLPELFCQLHHKLAHNPLSPVERNGTSWLSNSYS